MSTFHPFVRYFTKLCVCSPGTLMMAYATNLSLMSHVLLPSAAGSQ